MTISLALTLFALSSALAEAAGPSFRTIDVVIDSGTSTLAAYQIEIQDPTGRARVVGVEGGEHPSFVQPPYYDARALRSGRILLAALYEGQALPTGKTRVAVLHVEISGPSEPQLVARIVVAASDEAQVIPATVVLNPGGAS